jgi:hypothetical protein
MSDVLDDLFEELSRDTPLELATMFRSPAISSGGKIVAFLGRNDRLIMKLPRERAVVLMADGTVEAVTMGTRTMKEWVAVQLGSDPSATRETWLPLAREALTYVRTLAD